MKTLKYSHSAKGKLASCCIAFLASLSISCSLYSQSESKRPVREEDYSLWGLLTEPALSPNGDWLAFLMQYDDNPDTLIVRHTSNNRTWKIPNAIYGKFSGRHQYAAINDKNVLQLLELSTGTKQSFNDVHSFSISSNSNHLITLEGTEGKTSICIRDENGRMMERLEGLTHYKLNEQGTAMLCLGNADGKGQIALVHLGKQITKKIIAEGITQSFSQPVWGSSGKSLAFIIEEQETKRLSIGYYAVGSQKLHILNDQSDAFPAGYELSPVYANLSLSSDDRRVFFDIYKLMKKETRPEVAEVWNGSDALVLPKRKKIIDLENKIRYAAWWPTDDEVRLISDDRSPIYMLNPTKEYALTYSMTDKKPQYTMNLEVDYYVTQLKKGKKDLLVANQTTANNFTGFSPNGKYFAYFKDSCWWVYDFKKELHLNLSKANVPKCVHSENGAASSYGIAGWGVGDSCLFLYDHHDLWRVAFDGSSPVRLTNGREKGIVYRTVALGKNLLSNSKGSIEIDTRGRILLSGKGKDATGYFYLEPNGTVKTIVYNDFLNNSIIKADDTGVYAFQSQRYDNPPALHSYNTKKGAIRLAYQSNVQHWNYRWGRQEQITYTNSSNKKLKGILYYPADHDPSRKYPMVVSIYEELQYMKPYYFNPTVYNPAGFNIPALTSQGYFVLLPDIVYGKGNPGMDATDCVVAATTEVMGKGLIDTERIALMGHSFGGYETNFIITQTPLFRTAISGSSVFDLPSWYLSISRNSGDPEIWRFESQQWRMGKSLYQDRDSYYRNSPSSWVQRVTTPLLLWTGEKDPQIDPDQSVAYHLALRRLNKQNTLLMYLNESHSLIMKESQLDLYYRIKEWLDYHLKEESPPQWMKLGI